MKAILAPLAGATLIAFSSLASAQQVPAQPQVDVAIFAYPSSENYCPAGLQPIVLGGVICCGQPNTSGPAFVTHRASAPAPKRVVCPVGEKGCRTD